MKKLILTMDTPIKEIEKRFNLKLKSKKDMKLNEYLKGKGVPNLSLLYGS